MVRNALHGKFSVYLLHTRGEVVGGNIHEDRYIRDSMADAMVNVAVLGGGTSGEREISLQTAHQLARWIGETRYAPYVIDVQGSSWCHARSDGERVEVDKNDFSLPLPTGRISLDLAFIATHGTPGENGLLQGYLSLMGIPCSTGNTFSQALSFHKGACKRYVQEAVTVARSASLLRSSSYDTQRLVVELGLPLFVKPNDNGSSVGVARVRTPKELACALEEAFTVSDDVLLESAISGLEVSCGVFGWPGQPVEVLPVTEIVPPSEYFDFRAKYDGSTQEITPARISPDIAAEVQNQTRRVFELLQCRGFARADFILEEGKHPVFLEINTVPGMTAQSILPKQVIAAGYTMPNLLARLLDAMQQERVPDAVAK